MSIRQIQINRAIEKIVKHYLFHGRYPTFQTITHHFSQWLRVHRPGAPTFNPLKVLRKEQSDSNRYNENVDMLFTDISDAYEATIDHTKRVMRNFNHMETERQKMWHELSVLSNEIDQLLMVSGDADFKHFSGKTLNFESMHYVDNEASTIHVDIENQHVTLKENLTQMKKVQMNGANAAFKPLMPTAKTEALETIHNAFDESINTTWWQVVKTEEPGSTEAEGSMGMRAELTILFNNEEEFNEIRYLAHHGKPVFTKVEFTLDGSTFIPLPDKNNYREVRILETWQFQKIKAKGVKFIFEKKEHDDRSAGVYQYYFGAKEISITNKSYLSEGVLYTNPIEFDGAIRQLTMATKEEMPFNTNIEYEVALYEANKKLTDLTWYPISSYDSNTAKYAKVVEFNTKNVRSIETDKSNETGQVINGMKVFRLMKDNGDGIISEIMTNLDTGEETESFDLIKNAKLFRGINQWKRERTYVPFEASVPVNSKWQQELTDRPQSARVDYLPIGNRLDLRRGLVGVSDNFYRFTTCVYAEESLSHPLSLSVVHTLPSGLRKRLGTYSIYVNKERLIPSNDEVTMQFTRGWNEIQILIHWGDLQLRSDTKDDNLPNETYLGKFNFSRQTRVRADLRPMTYVDAHSLYHNISPNNREYFSIHERQIVLNYLPASCIFQLMYESDMNKAKGGFTSVIVRSSLKRNPDIADITPKIKSIRLRAK